MSNFGKCTVVVEGNAVKHVNDFLLPLCGESDEYVYGRSFNVQAKHVDEVLYVNFESNDKEGKYFTKHEGYEKLLECDFVYYKPKFDFDNL